MKTIVVNLYQFEELSTEAKQKAIENNRYVNVDYDWFDWIYEGTAEVGIKINSFDIYRRDIDMTIEDSEHTAKKAIEEYNKRSEISKISNQFLKDRDELIKKFTQGSDEYEKGIEDLEEEYRREVSKEVLSWLIEDYDYLMTDEAIAGTLIDNEYNFTGNGKMY